MGRKMEVAITQVKILDLDFGKEINERKELMEAAKAKLAEKIRLDERSKYDDLVRKAVVQVLAAKTVKRRKYGSEEEVEVWTAPIVLTIQEQADRWKME